jgi:hypothetical protein
MVKCYQARTDPTHSNVGNEGQEDGDEVMQTEEELSEVGSCIKWHD